jgi:D-2-hydroxyacid dehydrogenase (NADP+)
MKVLIYIQWPVKAWSIPDAYAATLADAFPDIGFVRAHNVDDAGRLLKDADIAFTPHLKPGMIAGAPRLRWVHSPAAAVEGLLPLSELASCGVRVTNSKGIQAVPIAEHVMGGLLMLSRRFDATHRAQTERRWVQNELTDPAPWLLHGQRMTIVGLGTIGIEIARRAHAFGMHVTGVRRRPEMPNPSFVDQVVGPDALDRAIAGADVLVLSAPGVSGTAGMIGAAQLAQLNRGAVLVNVARAAIVDQPAMRDALAEGRLGGAVLDVFEQEPLPPDDALWATPGVIITPHSSGFRASHWDAVTALFRDNLVRYLRGDTLHNPVDLALGY